MSHNKFTIREPIEPQEASPMKQEMHVLGIDIAKRVFHAVGMDDRGKIAHSIEFSGGVGHCSSKASRREDLEIEQPVACWDFSSFHFHPTLASMLGATLIRYQVVEVRFPRI
jgi:hypothetical protein